MKYYTFLHQFHPAILEGRKHSTIRGKPKVKPGERFALRFWSDKPYRSKMDFLGTAVCKAVVEISFIEEGEGLAIEMTMPTEDLDASLFHLDSIASMEGFNDANEMISWFREKRGFPFSGVLTVWDPDTFMPGEPES